MARFFVFLIMKINSIKLGQWYNLIITWLTWLVNFIKIILNFLLEKRCLILIQVNFPAFQLTRYIRDSSFLPDQTDHVW